MSPTPKWYLPVAIVALLFLGGQISGILSNVGQSV